MYQTLYKAMKNNNKLDKIKEELPFGAISEIAKRSEVSYQTVTRVLQGKSKNIRVMKAITDYLKEMNDNTQSFNSVANQYLSPVQ